jgi:nuclear protein localization family protein 4
MFTPEEFKQLCSLVTSQDGDMDQLNHINGWNTLQMVLKEAGKELFITTSFFY